MLEVQVKHIVLLVASVLLFLLGCWRPYAPRPAELDRGLVWVIPGINGRPHFRRAYLGLRDGGVDSAIEVYNWHGDTPLENLQAAEANRAAAAEIAQRIATYAVAHPGRPIDVVGYSGGGGMAPMVAEALPPEVRLRNVLLVQAAISPEYDLTRCLQQVDGKLLNFYCESDRLILGAGTMFFGTIDRKHVPSAGQQGFDVEHALPDPELHARFEQREWTLDMLFSGHLGGHRGISVYEWNRDFIAPLLLHPSKIKDRIRLEPEDASGS